MYVKDLILMVDHYKIIYALAEDIGYRFNEPDPVSDVSRAVEAVQNIRSAAADNIAVNEQRRIVWDKERPYVVNAPDNDYYTIPEHLEWPEILGSYLREEDIVAMGAEQTAIKIVKYMTKLGYSAEAVHEHIVRLQLSPRVKKQ